MSRCLPPQVGGKMEITRRPIGRFPFRREPIGRPTERTLRQQGIRMRLRGEGLYASSAQRSPRRMRRVLPPFSNKWTVGSRDGRLRRKKSYRVRFSETGDAPWRYRPANSLGWCLWCVCLRAYAFLADVVAVSVKSRNHISSLHLEVRIYRRLVTRKLRRVGQILHACRNNSHDILAMTWKTGARPLLFLALRPGPHRGLAFVVFPQFRSDRSNFTTSEKQISAS